MAIIKTLHGENGRETEFPVVLYAFQRKAYWKGKIKTCVNKAGI